VIRIHATIFAALLLAPCVALCADNAPTSSDLSARRSASDARAILDRTAKAHPATVFIQTRPSRHIDASMVFAVGAPKLSADEWLLYMPQPPETAGQRNISFKAAPEVKKIAEPSGLKQPLLLWQIPAVEDKKHLIAVNITYSADLLAHKLVPLREGQQPADLQPLSAEERSTYSAATDLLDWAAPQFQEWLTTNKLRPAETETDLDLARRIFLHLKEHSDFEFKQDIERHVSRTCRTMKSDCGGLTALYVAALRANAIPARQLVGRWAQSAKKGEQLYGKPWQKEHIKAEFYAAGIGWVPVDVSVAVDFDKKPGSLEHFGNDPGDFLEFHFDADVMLDVPKIGRRSIRFMQEPAYFFLGRGSLDGDVKQSDWIVESTRPRR
jgi:hypothetical protein